MKGLTVEEKVAGLTQVAKEVRACTKCALAAGRTHSVPGAGPANSEVMFIGEGPGFNEDQQGLPFVGASGRFLEELLASIGMNRKEVFIGNVVKCRPPENRDPLPDEITTCTTNYLYRQIDLVEPKIIVTLGRYSMGLFFQNAKITAIHGQPKWEHERFYLPMFHPAAILRNQSLKPQAFADFKKIPELLADYDRRTVKASSTPEKSDPDSGSRNEPPTQLSMF